MKSSLNHFLTILADNSYTPRYKDIPDYVDNRDEILAEQQQTLDEGGHLDDTLRYFSVNGKTNASELTESLEKSFSRFRAEFFSGKQETNDALRTELLNQLDRIKKIISQAIFETKQIGDKTLDAMMEVKLQICDEVIDFIMGTQDSTSKTEEVADNKKRLSYKWLKGDECLQVFYHKMKHNGLIAADTQESDFKAVFSNIPLSDIKNPIQWEKGTKIFAYFLKQLMDNRFIPVRPSWALVDSLFTYRRNDVGQYVPIKSDVKTYITQISETGAPKGADAVDSLFNMEN